MIASATGAARRDQAFDLFAETRQKYLLAMQRMFVLLLLERGEASIDDVRDKVPLPNGIDPRCSGAVHVPFLRAKIIVECAYAPSTRAIAHARRVIRWRLANPERAQRWLDEHQLDEHQNAAETQQTFW